jgi:hypothetical protein
MVNKEIVMSLIHALEQALPKGEVVVVGSAKSKGLTEANKAWLASLIGVEPTADKTAISLDLLDVIQEEIEDVIAKHRVAIMTEAEAEDDDEDDEDEDDWDEDDEDTDDDDEDEPDEDDDDDEDDDEDDDDELASAFRMMVHSTVW